jgi:GNAT superfamily N-acetyltransferase
MTRQYPTEIAGPYEPPPRAFVDAEGREIAVRWFDGDSEPLVEMYRAFDPEDRAQGIPPTEESSIRDWLDTVLAPDCITVVAVYDGAVVGHAMLVPDRHGASELAIFVLGAYQGAGIGTVLTEALLGAGRRAGVDRIWLTVERWNAPAIALYRKVGFEASDDSGFEIEMAATLREPGE